MDLIILSKFSYFLKQLKSNDEYDLYNFLI